MSSSGEEVVRRPGRSGRGQSPAGSEQSNTPAADNMDLDQPNGDDDADLFGSDGDEGGLEELAEDEYGYAYVAVNTAPADPVPLVNPSEDSTMNNWIPATTRAVMIERKIAWITRVQGKGSLERPSTLWTWV